MIIIFKNSKTFSVAKYFDKTAQTKTSLTLAGNGRQEKELRDVNDETWRDTLWFTLCMKFNSCNRIKAAESG